MEITIATMGRLIKNFDIRLFAFSFHGEWLSVHLHPRSHLLHALNNDAFATLQSIGNDPLGANSVAHLHGSDAYLVLIVHHRYLIAAL
jgi:hypothetical protein